MTIFSLKNHGEILLRIIKIRITGVIKWGILDLISCVVYNIQREKTLNIGEITIIGNNKDNAQIEANMNAVKNILNSVVRSIVPQRSLAMVA